MTVTYVYLEVNTFIFIKIFQTRVLVTHGVHWLTRVDQIIVMKNGEISEVGTYNELLQNDKEFSQFLKTYNSGASDTTEDVTDNDGKCTYKWSCLFLWICRKNNQNQDQKYKILN